MLRSAATILRTRPTEIRSPLLLLDRKAVSECRRRRPSVASSLWTANVSRATYGHEPLGVIPGRDLDVSRAKRPTRIEGTSDDPVRYRRGQAQEVAAKVDRYPSARACVFERIPPRSVDAGRQGAAVEKRAWRLTAERCGGGIEPQDDGVVEQLDGDEPDHGIER